jgi:hypothetical protein
MGGIARIPQTSYTFYRLFQRNADRGLYQAPYFLKRTNLGAAALRLFLGETIDPASATRTTSAALSCTWTARTC